MALAAPTHHDGSHHQRDVSIRGDKIHLSFLGTWCSYVGIHCGIINITDHINLVSSQGY